MISKSFLYGLSFALISSVSMSATAQEDDCILPYSQAYHDCMDNSSGATYEMLDCIGAEYEYQDALLNTAYKKLMRNLSAERKKTLKQAQKAWIQFRDGNCSFYYDPEGGSLARIMGNDCSMRMTAERAKELDELSSMEQ